MNREIIHQWYCENKDGIFRFAFSLLKDTHLAEDVLQEVFLRLLTGKYEVKPGAERAWLYKVARNCSYDILRRKKRESPVREEIGSDTDRYVYIELMAALGRRDQEIVTLKIIGGLTHREIGKVMGMTEHAVKKRYQRAIEKLREG